MVKAAILAPKDYVGTIMELCQSRRGTLLGMEYLGEDRVEIRYTMPLGEIVFDFFDHLKSKTAGYASLDYEPSGDQEADLVKVDILLQGEPVDAFSAIVHRDKAYAYGVLMTERLKKLIPRQQFEVPIQAAIGARIIARESIRAMRKDVLAKCYGGDITRKRKLLEKQKEGKKRMKMVGRVEVPQEAFIAALSGDTESKDEEVGWSAHAPRNDSGRDGRLRRRRGHAGARSHAATRRSAASRPRSPGASAAARPASRPRATPCCRGPRSAAPGSTLKRRAPRVRTHVLGRQLRRRGQRHRSEPRRGRSALRRRRHAVRRRGHDDHASTGACAGMRADGELRVIFAIEEPRRVGFALGTVGGSVVSGEESFMLEWYDNDEVWFTVRAFDAPVGVAVPPAARRSPAAAAASCSRGTCARSRRCTRPPA